MDDHAKKHAAYSKTAACACGALKVSVTAQPQKVHACTCLDCQRMSGSCFSYTAFFPESATSVAGAFRAWRRIASSGRWADSHFCVECGSRVFTRLEALPGFVGVAVGCFGDPDFEMPATLYWTTRRHQWLSPPAGVGTFERQ